MSLTALEIARMRLDADDHLPDTCVIRRSSDTPDGKGGVTQIWSDLATAACSLGPAPLAANEKDVAGRILHEDKAVLIVPWNTDIEITDRVVFGGVTYEIVNIDTPRSWQLNKTVQMVDLS